MTPALLTVEEAAVALRLHPDTVRRHLRNGTIAGMRVGSVWRVPVEATRMEIPRRLPAPRVPRGRFRRQVWEQDRQEVA